MISYDFTMKSYHCFGPNGKPTIFVGPRVARLGSSLQAVEQRENLRRRRDRSHRIPLPGGRWCDGHPVDIPTMFWELKKHDLANMFQLEQVEQTGSTQFGTLRLIATSRSVQDGSKWSLGGPGGDKAIFCRVLQRQQKFAAKMWC